ncbi:HAD family hydrolase [Lacticaseibacillus sp. GG6-2]
MTQIKLIASDLDHTLLTDAGELPPHFLDTIRRVHDAGIHFVAASGRPLYTLKPMFEPAKDYLSLLAENGAVVMRDGEIVHTQFIPKADYVHLIHYTQNQGLGEPLLCALDTAYIGESAAEHADFLRQFFMKLKIVPDLTALDVPVAKYTVFFPGKDTYRVFDDDYAKPLADEFHVTIGGDYFLDIMHKAVNKGSSLKALGAQLGVKPEEMVVFGDNLNDTEMLQMAGHSFIVEAAHARLEPYATRIGSNADYAVAEKIISILDNGGELS